MCVGVLIRSAAPGAPRRLHHRRVGLVGLADTHKTTSLLLLFASL